MEVSAVGDLHADWVRELLGIPISATGASAHLKVMRGATTGDASWRGCRIKPFRKPRGPLAEWAASAAERDDLTTEHTRATNEMAVFGARP